MTLFIVVRKLKLLNDNVMLFSQNIFIGKRYSIPNNQTSSLNLIQKIKNKQLSPQSVVNYKPEILQIDVKTVTRNFVGNFFSYIEEISHMDEVRNAQNKVIQIKDALKEVGDRKREILYDLNAIRNEIQKNHTEICNAMRGTERYVTLVRDEMTLLNKEQKAQIDFTQADENERNLFNNMTTAINDSYEKEKIHSNFIKVLGLIGTLTASIVTLIASAIGHYYHNTKFGLVANDFKENVNHTIKKEINILKDSLKLDITTAMNKQEELLKKLNENKKILDHVSKESWISYIKRHTYNILTYFIPKTHK